MEKIKNSYHNTEASVASIEKLEDALLQNPWHRTPAQKSMIRRAWKKLCGIKGCACCDEAGRR